MMKKESVNWFNLIILAPVVIRKLKATTHVPTLPVEVSSFHESAPNGKSWAFHELSSNDCLYQSALKEFE